MGQVAQRQLGKNEMMNQFSVTTVKQPVQMKLGPILNILKFMRVLVSVPTDSDFKHKPTKTIQMLCQLMPLDLIFKSALAHDEI